MTGSVDEGSPAGNAPPTAHAGLAGAWRSTVERLARGLDRLRLPGAMVLPVLAQTSLADALARMDAADLDALPVVDPDRPDYPYGVVTRTAAARVKRRVLGSTGGPTMAPTEES